MCSKISSRRFGRPKVQSQSQSRRYEAFRSNESLPNELSLLVQHNLSCYPIVGWFGGLFQKVKTENRGSRYVIVHATDRQRGRRHRVKAEREVLVVPALFVIVIWLGANELSNQFLKPLCHADASFQHVGQYVFIRLKMVVHPVTAALQTTGQSASNRSPTICFQQ